MSTDFLMIELLKIESEPGSYFTKNLQLANYNEAKQKVDEIREAGGVASLEVSTYQSWTQYLSTHELQNDGIC